MSNDCFNRLIINGHIQEVFDFLQKVGLRNNPLEFDFNQIEPLGDRDPLDVWGARHGCKRVEEVELDPNHFSDSVEADITFVTHWCGVEPLIRSLAHQYPHWIISYGYTDEENTFGGEVDAHIAAGLYKFERRDIVEPTLSDELFALFEPSGADRNDIEIDLREAYEADVRKIQVVFIVVEGRETRAFVSYLNSKARALFRAGSTRLEKVLEKAVLALIDQQQWSSEFWNSDEGYVQFTLELKDDRTVPAYALCQYAGNDGQVTKEYEVGKKDGSST